MSSPAAGSQGLRDHLFISYANEDWPYVEWLASKLTAQGYRVWCDRFKLLGGESYPRDIDTAIAQRAFRFLAVLSRHSLTKPNPLKERTLALNIARERAENFVIPLNLDGLAPHELGWMASDLTFIPFREDWAVGLRQLLKQLESIAAPRALPDGETLLTQWSNARDVARETPERLWSNVFDVVSMPADILRVTADDPIESLLGDWPAVKEGDRAAWMIEVPDALTGSEFLVRSIRWREAHEPSVNPRHIVTSLLRQYIVARCVTRGLIPHSQPGKGFAFPITAGVEGWIPYTMPSGRRSRIRVVGTRRFWTPGGGREEVRYSLRAFLRPTLYLLEAPCVLIHVGLSLTDLAGHPLPDAVAFRRERAIRKTWHNGAWLARILAVAEYLRGPDGEVALARGASCRLAIAPSPRSYMVPVGYDEEALGAIEDNDDAELRDELEPDATDGLPDA